MPSDAETDEVQLLTRKRAAYKGQLTNFVNYLKELNVSSMSPEDGSELQMRLNKVRTTFDNYDEVQLLLECSSDLLQAQAAERREFESLYYKTVAKAQIILDSFLKSQTDNVSNSSKSLATVFKNVRLPTIQLPKFNGNYDSWLEFRDTFSSLVHNNDDLDYINKFHYLRSSLEGSAAVVIQAIEFSALNYSTAWQLLCERFDNKRVLINNHVSALFNIETVTKESSVILKRVIDNVMKNLRALSSLGEPTDQWDTLLIYIITHKLDTKTFREWEEFKTRISIDDSITFEKLITFLRNRADLIETLEQSRNNSVFSYNKGNNNNKIKTLVSVQNHESNTSKSASKISCPKCTCEHTLNNCSQFLSLSNESRIKLLPSLKVCYNCLRPGHYANRCHKPGCKICKRRHNTLIHIADGQTNTNESLALQWKTSILEPVSTPPPASAGATEPTVTLSASVTSSVNGKQGEVLLSTAIVKLYDVCNCEHTARVLLDSGSTSCLITEKMFQRLNLPINRVNKSILGINNVSSKINKSASIPMKSFVEDFSVNLNCFILPSITDSVPCQYVDISQFNIPPEVTLADPNFYKPASIDLIIGADLFWDILGSQKISLHSGGPILQETRLGWIISGPINNSYFNSPIKCHFTKIDEIQSQLMRFWELEEVSPTYPEYSKEERLCEEHFTKNTTRLADGRFCVRIPLKEDPSCLGNSFQRAKHCLLSLERRFNRSTRYSEMYKDFMAEYESLGHMSRYNLADLKPNSYFIPHHGVLREASTTTKLRVVFNASSPTTSGVSLNNLQMVGPTVQNDLLSILLRFRFYKYVISADVEKMYRTVMVHPDDRHLQQILWRNDSSLTLNVFQLNTVTYGTASAPFLATRCLKQIGLDCKDRKIGEIICNDFYVDDLLTGGDSLQEIITIREKVSAELASAQMHLRKWKSNINLLVPDSTNEQSIDLNIGQEPNKVLGLGWQPNDDQLYFSINNVITDTNTKRNMLSIISQIFDPLGLLSPITINMKMLLQKLWLLKVSWDEPVTLEISEIWYELLKQLPNINSIRIPRIVVCDNYKSLNLHIFTDASERAYGACLYISSCNDKGKVLVRLLMAKSRVAPIKPTTIPRLELCGALVGSRLYEKVKGCLRVPINSVTFWTDSTIVLGWLKMIPNKLQPFVRNRVAEILEKTSGSEWRHVRTDINPADFISRGVSVDTINSLDLWWFGPSFLKQDQSLWPLSPSSVTLLPELRPEISMHTTSSSKPHCTNYNNFINFERFSNFLRLKRAIAYLLRFINVCKKQSIKNEFLSDDELQCALNVIIIQSQRESFPEYKLLEKKHNLPKTSNLLKFNVFLDQNNLMRVGGRLDNSNFSFNKKHPIILQSTHRFTKLLFNYQHIKLFHAGPQLLLASLRETYWPIGGRNLAKSCYHQCVKCRRMKGQVVAPLMGNLPQQRLEQGGYPFESVGVDYAGPIHSASRQGRGCRLVKVYIAIFICFTTKAIHLELVGDLTNSSFILTLKRFISRRGKPRNIFSDNGTSFVGAYNELSRFLKSNCNSFSEYAANEEIKFHFIPAYSPHFGGLWEAGVKSTKYHLRRVLGDCNLTYEELNTTLIQIEAILNSRPLTPLSSDPEDLLPLTPGHFLIGRALTSLPSQDLQERSQNNLTRFNRIEQLRQIFWTRWSTEYIAQLQTRTKWQSRDNPLKMNSLVLLKDNNLPPLKWKMGRIVALYPGADGVNRVADVRTAAGVVRRSFSKICPLPVEEETSG